MVLTPHMLVGAAIGSWSKSIWSVFVLALVSHYFLDFLPHWDYLDQAVLGSWIDLAKVGIDLLIGAALVIFLSLKYSRKQRELIFFSAGLAMFPDFINYIYVNFNLEWLKVLADFHSLIHYWNGLSFWQGFPAAILVVLISIYALRRKWG